MDFTTFYSSLDFVDILISAEDKEYEMSRVQDCFKGVLILKNGFKHVLLKDSFSKDD